MKKPANQINPGWQLGVELCPSPVDFTELVTDLEDLLRTSISDHVAGSWETVKDIEARHGCRATPRRGEGFILERRQAGFIRLSAGAERARS